MSISSFLSKRFQGGAKNAEDMREDSFTRALDLGQSRILYVEGKIQGEKIHLNHLAQTPLNANITLPLALKSLFEEQGCSREQIRLSLKSPQAVTRFLRFPKMSEKELRGVLQFEIEQYIPYEAKDLYMDIAILQESMKTDQGELVEIFVAVAKKDHIDPLVKQFRDNQSDIALVDVDMLACMKCLEFFHPKEFEEHTAVLDLGAQITTLGVVRSGKPRFIRDLSFGSQDIAKKLKSRMTLADSEIFDFIHGKLTATEDNQSIFLESFENLLNDVKVSFDYYRDQSDDGAGPDKLFVCGGGSAQDLIVQTLEKTLEIPVCRFDLFSRLDVGGGVSQDLLTAFLPELPVALGLLLREND